MRKKTKWTLIVLGIVFGVAALLALMEPPPKRAQDKHDGPDFGKIGSLVKSTAQETTFPSCGDKDDWFSVSPVARKDVAGFVPLGNVAPPGGHVFPTDHIYYHVVREDPDDWRTNTIKADVFAPGDITITQITAQEKISHPDVDDDYGMRFFPCAEIQGFFIHLTSISEPIRAAFDEAEARDCNEYATGDGTYRTCEKSLNIELAAGDLVGTAGGGYNKNALDLGVIDERRDPHPYANPDRWPKQTTYIQCPLDYFTEDVRDEWVPLFGSHDGKNARSVEPVCGAVEQDEPGTAQGVWIQPGQQDTFPEDPHLALVHDNYDGTQGVFSIGREMPPSITSDLLRFDPKHEGNVNRDFDEVVPGSVYCYEELRPHNSFENPNAGYTIVLELENETTLRIADRAAPTCGTGPWELPADAAKLDR